MNNHPISPESVPGFAIDADPENDPCYPMRTRCSATHEGYTWERPAQQKEEAVKVLESIERPQLPAVFGTSVPPRGLSGALRRMAFLRSESSYGHWLPLMLADRIGVVEGLLEDLADGHLPNMVRERGWGAEWKHNRASLVTRLSVGAAIVTGLVAGVRLLARRR